MRKFSIMMALLMSAIIPISKAAPVYDANNMEETVPVYAQTDSDSAASSLTSEQRLNRLEEQMKNVLQNDWIAKINSLQTEVQNLRGKIDELNHRLELMQNQPRVTQSRPENKPQSLTPVSTPTTTVALQKQTDIKQPDAAQEEQAYQTAYQLIKTGKYDEAITTFQNLLQKYPHGQFASNTHYWLGELYNLTNKPDRAANEFNTVITDFAKSQKVPDAMLKLGMLNADQGKSADAKQWFNKVIKNYPDTSSARLAAQQMKQVRQ